VDLLGHDSLRNCGRAPQVSPKRKETWLMKT
jgi:hypothetical protein